MLWATQGSRPTGGGRTSPSTGALYPLGCACSQLSGSSADPASTVDATVVAGQPLQ